MFLNAGEVPNTTCLGRWDGNNWFSLGASGFVFDAFHPQIVSAIAIDGNDVYIGGQFPQAGGVNNTSNIARWNDPLTAITTPYSPTTSNQLEIYPNPTHDVVRYKLDQSVINNHQVTLFDLTGRVFYSAQKERPELTVLDLAPGVYYLRVDAQAKRYIAHFIKV